MNSSNNNINTNDRRYKKEANNSHGHRHTPFRTISNCSFCHATQIWKSALSSSLAKDTKLHRITYVSWPCCLLAAAEINPVLARARTFSAPYSIPSQICPDPAPSDYYMYIHIYINTSAISMGNDHPSKVCVDFL